MEKQELSTISKQVEKNNRHSLPEPPATSSRRSNRLTQSQNYGYVRPHVPPTIPEVDTPEEEVQVQLPQNSLDRSNSRASKSSRSARHKTSKNYHVVSINNNGYENKAYDGPQPETSSMGRMSYDTRSYASTNTSRNPSLQSLSVTREQYCCASKWSPCERKLVACVTVLATIIVILVIVVGVIAGGDDGLVDENFRWKL